MPHRSRVALAGMVMACGTGALSVALAASAYFDVDPGTVSAADSCAASAMLSSEQQALQIAQLAQDLPGLDATARTIADDAEADALARIDRWRTWLAEHPRTDGASAPSGHDHGAITAPFAGCAGDGATDVGQLLAELAGQRGAAGTTGFAQVLIAHHEDAVALATAVVFDGEDDTLVAAAQRALDTLSARTAQLKTLLPVDG